MTLMIARRIFQKAASLLFSKFEFLGFHVTPTAYDSPIPVTDELYEELFDKESACIGLDWNLNVQHKYLRKVFSQYAAETDFANNPNLSLVDSAILHAMIRHHKPEKIVEIGSGWSTLIAARSCDMNRAMGLPCQQVAIDPFPKRFLRASLPSSVRLVEKTVQTVGLEDIVDCDLLFIDSSHVVKIGGDVNHELLEIVPRLKPGALVHWHDILLPGEYWKTWVKDKHYIWSEQYLLQAFLQFNQEFEVIWASRYMHLNSPEAITAAFPFFDRQNHRISSFWIRRKP